MIINPWLVSDGVLANVNLYSFLKSKQKQFLTFYTVLAE